jgi:hypothetical protein
MFCHCLNVGEVEIYLPGVWLVRNKQHNGIFHIFMVGWIGVTNILHIQKKQEGKTLTGWALTGFRKTSGNNVSPERKKMFGEISEMFKVFCLLKSVAGLNRHNTGLLLLIMIMMMMNAVQNMSSDMQV